MKFNPNDRFVNDDKDRYAPIVIMAVVDNWIMAKKELSMSTPFCISEKDFKRTFITDCKYKKA